MMRALGYSWQWVVIPAFMTWGLFVLVYLKLMRAVQPVLDRCFPAGEVAGPGRKTGERWTRGVLSALAIMVLGGLTWDHLFSAQLEPLLNGRSRSTLFKGIPAMTDPACMAQEKALVAAYLATHPHADAPRPLVLITVDALRSDQMGVYGGAQENTPFLEAQLRKGALRRLGPMYSTSSFSYAGLLGMLGSKYFHQLTPQPWNLADALKQMGYATYFILSGDHTNFIGLRNMYGPSIDVYRDGSSQRVRYANDDRLVLDALDQQVWPDRQPVFLYIHLMSTHELGSIEPEFQRWEREPISSEPYQGLRNRYQDRVLQADARIRQIFGFMANHEAFKNALVVITADHGEYLGEFGRTEHGQEPYEPVARIPLLVADPGGPKYPPRSLSSLVDIAPTFLAAIGAPIPPNWVGIPLQWETSRQTLVIGSIEVSGVVGQYQGHRYKFFRQRKDGEEMLFDLDSQAGERWNRVSRPSLEPVEANRDSGALAKFRLEHSQLTQLPRLISGGIVQSRQPALRTTILKKTQ